MCQGLTGGNPFVRIQLKTLLHEINSFLFFIRQTSVRTRRILLSAAGTPKYNLLPRVSGFGDRGQICVQYLTVHERHIAHTTLAEDGAELNECVNVVSRVEERKASAQQGEENDAAGPVVDDAHLRRAFEQHFWSAEASRAGSIGSSCGALVVAWI